MDRADEEAACGKVVGKLGGGAFGARKDNGFSAPLSLEDAGHHSNFVHAVCLEDHLSDVLVGLCSVGFFSADVHWLVHEGAREGDNGSRHGRGKQHGLVLVGECLEELLNGGEETEVEHFVGFIKHQNGHLVEGEGAALVQVEEPAGGTHHYVNAFV